MSEFPNVPGAAPKRDLKPLLISRDDAAVRLSCCVRTIDNLIDRGELPFVKLLRRRMLRLADVEAWVDAHTERGQG